MLNVSQLARFSPWDNSSTRREQSELAAAVGGDRAAFDSLAQRYDAELRLFVARRVDRDAVDDVLQDVWLAVWSALPRFDRRSRFRTWMYGICLNKCKDFYRQQLRVAGRVPLDDSTLGAADGQQGAVELQDQVQRLVAELSEPQREVVELYYYGELTMPEIATILQRNLNTVKYQFYRAHSELEAKMRETDR